MFQKILGRGRGGLANTNRYVRPLWGVKKTSVNCKSSEIRCFPTFWISTTTQSNPHDCQFRWVWFLLSLACALQSGGQRETWPGTRSYLTFWKLQHILVTQCLPKEGGVVPCKFIVYFVVRSQEECGWWKSGWSPERLCSFSLLTLVSVLLLISCRTFRFPQDSR